MFQVLRSVVFTRFRTSHLGLAVLYKSLGQTFRHRAVQNSSYAAQERAMKLFTDEGNPFTLKVLLASNVAKADVEIKVVDKKSKQYLII